MDAKPREVLLARESCRFRLACCMFNRQKTGCMLDRRSYTLAMQTGKAESILSLFHRKSGHVSSHICLYAGEDDVWQLGMLVGSCCRTKLGVVDAAFWSTLIYLATKQTCDFSGPSILSPLPYQLRLFIAPAMADSVRMSHNLLLLTFCKI